MTMALIKYSIGLFPKKIKVREAKVTSKLPQRDRSTSNKGKLSNSASRRIPV